MIYLPTFLDAALAQIQTTMIEIEERTDGPERLADAYAELDQAYARIVRARKLLK